MALLDLQLSVENEGWPGEDSLHDLAARVLETAAVHLQRQERQPFPPDPTELSLVFTDDASIREINAQWRGKDKPTNVLSFPAFPIAPGDKAGPMLGDIVLARETVEREATELEKTVNDHLTHLMVHGFLHLFGYDHIYQPQAEIMEKLEIRILAELGLSDPYEGQDLKLEQ